jgi:hypothetical protein
MDKTRDTVAEAEERAAKNGAKLDLRTIRADLEDRFGRPLTVAEDQAAFRGWNTREDDRRQAYRLRTERIAAEARELARR